MGPRVLASHDWVHPQVYFRTVEGSTSGPEESSEDDHRYKMPALVMVALQSGENTGEMKCLLLSLLGDYQDIF